MKVVVASRHSGDQHVQSCIRQLTVHTKRWVEIDGRFAIGHHGFDLLEAIERTGSIADAARRLGWSYRHAWGYLRAAEGTFRDRLVVVRPGKGSAKGTSLTPVGREVLRMGRSLKAMPRTLTLATG
jgi:molybdate transport system regulatory protein